MHKRLKDYVNRRHVVDYPVLPVASNEAVLKMLAEVAETMRAKDQTSISASGIAKFQQWSTSAASTSPLQTASSREPGCARR